MLMAGFFLLGGMAAASSTGQRPAGGGLFPPEQRGLAMGIRQTAQPLGVGLGALVIPGLPQITASGRQCSSPPPCARWPP